MAKKSESKKSKAKTWKGAQKGTFVKAPGGRWHLNDERSGEWKGKGNRVVAFRADRSVVSAFVKECGGNRNAWAFLRGCMERKGGVKAEASDE